VLHEPIGLRRGGGQLRSTCRLSVGHSGLGAAADLGRRRAAGPENRGLCR
jgi:hypothetical protein